MSLFYTPRFGIPGARRSLGHKVHGPTNIPCQDLGLHPLCPVSLEPTQTADFTVRDDYIKDAQKKIPDPNILINVVSRRVKQLKMGQKPLVESLERLSPEDIALREIIEGKITYELYVEESPKKY